MICMTSGVGGMGDSVHDEFDKLFRKGDVAPGLGVPGCESRCICV